jgi:hypothetical protein
MNTQEELKETVFFNPTDTTPEDHTPMWVKPQLFHQGYGLGYLPENFQALPHKEQVRVSYATLVGNEYSIEQLQLFLQVSDEELPSGLSRRDVAYMVQKRLEWQKHVIQLLMQDTL